MSSTMPDRITSEAFQPEARVIQGDALQVMAGFPDGSFDMVFTSPPYNLRDPDSDMRGFHKGSFSQTMSLRNGYAGYGDDMPYEEYVTWQQDVLRECWRLLVDDGAIYYNHKPRVRKDAAGVPRLRTPLELNPDLPLRQIIIWKRSIGMNWSRVYYKPVHEWILLLAKPAFRLRNMSVSGVGDVWDIPPDFEGDHPAPFPVALPMMALHTTSARAVLDPFCGRGSTGEACVRMGRSFVGIDIAEEYCMMARERIAKAAQSGRQMSFVG